MDEVISSLAKIITLTLFLPAVVSSVTIPFDPSRGLVEIEVTIDRRVKGTFGIDTGADRLYIDRTFAQENGLTFVPSPVQRAVVGVEGSVTVSAMRLSLFEIEDEQFKNIAATAIDISALVTDNSAGLPDGLIGYQILRKFFVTIDYPKRTLTLESDPPRFLNGKQFSEVPYTSYRHLIIVDAVINGDVAAPLILDYCASYTTISPKLAERLGLESKTDKLQIINSISLSEDVTTEKVPIFVTSLMNLKKSVPRAKFDGILGSTFLNRHKVTIDYAAKKVYFRSK